MASMKSQVILEKNKLAESKRSEFFQCATLEADLLINERFHFYKNHYPYYGLIDVDITDCAPFVMYSNNDDLIAMTYFWYGQDSYERCSIYNWISASKDSDTVLDIGSFSGLYSLASCSANTNVKVHAFEATRRVHARLLMNAQLNDFSQRIKCQALAVSDKSGVLNFKQYRAENILGNGASFIDKGIPITSDDELVRSIAIDEYIRDLDLLPDLIKIDVEEAEVLVLEGMQDLLSHCKPRIFVEVVPRTQEEVANILKRHGYKVKIIAEGKNRMFEYDSSLINGVTNLYCEIG